jgi:hypothetical protein
MKKNFRSLVARAISVIVLSCLGLVWPSASAHAEGSGDDAWILSAGTASLLIQTGTPETSTYGIDLAIGHSIGAPFELLALVNFADVVNPGFVENSDLTVVGQFNWVLIGSHSDAFYVGARLGEDHRVLYGTPIDSTIFGASVGKRFSLVPYLSFEPTLTMAFYDTSGTISSPSVSIEPIQFTLTF